LLKITAYIDQGSLAGLLEETKLWDEERPEEGQGIYHN